MADNELKIKPELAQALLDYLSMQPYREVYKLIPAIQALPKVTAPVDGGTLQDDEKG